MTEAGEDGVTRFLGSFLFFRSQCAHEDKKIIMGLNCVVRISPAHFNTYSHKFKFIRQAGQGVAKIHPHETGTSQNENSC